MEIKKLFTDKKAVFSFEIFPPKPTSPIGSIERTLEGISALKPDYISITCGAGGSAVRENATFNLAKRVKSEYGIEPLVHVTAIHSEKEDISALLSAMDEEGLNNILALRGDINRERKLSDSFRYASDLISFINARGKYGVSAACCPEGHIESSSLSDDIDRLKYKVDCGVVHLNSQMCFNNDKFYSFLERARKAGVNVPIEVGIMPVVKKTQIERIISLSGVEFPSKFSRIIARYSESPEALATAGIAYATEQIIDLLTSGVDGIHLYMMNNVDVATKITNNVKTILDGINANA